MKNENQLGTILSALPLPLREDISSTVRKYSVSENGISDIRLRADGASFISAGRKSFPLKSVIGKEMLEDIVYTLSDGSVYAHTETIREGFINFRGYRCGIVGRAVSKGGEVCSVYEYSSVSIRIPHDVFGCGERIYDLLKDNSFGGVMIYSPPAVGKTTLLRDLIRFFSSESRQFSVIDTRGELSSACVGTSADVLLYYPKAVGISSAVRSMSPEFIICDELSGRDDAASALYAHSCGVPMISSAHAGSFSELYKRSENAMLFDSGVFSYAIGIKRENVRGGFIFDIKAIQ